MPSPLTKTEHVELHGKLRIQFMRHGHSQSKAYLMADSFLFQKTGQRFHSSARSSYGNPNAAAGYRTPKYHTEKSAHEEKPRGSCGRMFPERDDFHNGPGRFSRSEHSGRGADSTRRYGESSYVYTTEELEAIEKDIYETWVKRGAPPDHARHQAKIWFNRYASKNVRSSSTSEPSRSDRPSASDDLSGMGNASNSKESCRGRTSGPPHCGFMHGSHNGQTQLPGREYPVISQHSTDMSALPSGPFQGYYFYKENKHGIPRFYTQHEPFVSKDARRGFQSPFDGYNCALDNDNAPLRYFHGRARDRTVKEHYAGGFPPFRSTYGPKCNFNDYNKPPHQNARNEREYNSRSSSNWPPTESSGIKPPEDLYATLHISPSASAEDIKQAHRKLSLMYHPDREKGNPTAKKAATERMARINQAYDVLKDDEMRAFYDRTGLIAGST